MMKYTRYVYDRRGDGVFVVILKNASTTMNTLLQHHLRWQSAVDLSDVPNSNFFAIIRHPVDRWVSIYCELYAEIGKNFQKKNFSTFVKAGFPPPFDKTQSELMRYAPDPTLFVLEDYEKVLDYLGVKDKEGRELFINNHAEDHAEVYAEVQAILKKNPKYKEVIAKQYGDDMDLYEKVGSP